MSKPIRSPGIPPGLALESALLAEAQRDLINCEYEEAFEDAQAVGEALRHIRLQLRSIIESLRLWRAAHGRISHPLRRRYSIYEGALIRQDLRQHWAFYFLAQRHYHALRRECDFKAQGACYDEAEQAA